MENNYIILPQNLNKLSNYNLNAIFPASIITCMNFTEISHEIYVCEKREETEKKEEEDC